MSFLDLVGIGVARISSDLNIDASLAQLIPSSAFLWFLLLSVPVQKLNWFPENISSVLFVIEIFGYIYGKIISDTCLHDWGWVYIDVAKRRPEGFW